VIATEGRKTEPEYFSLLQGKAEVKLDCIRGRDGTSPQRVLQRLQDRLEEGDLDRNDEAWLVVDMDDWTDEQLRTLHRWAIEPPTGKGPVRGFALSNPKFEYWLLLHFEDGSGVTSARICSERLRGHLANYDKGIDPAKFTLERICEAVARGRKRDTPPCQDWPRTIGNTTVYRLVGRIIGADGV
jgi:hypothetical protein